MHGLYYPFSWADVVVRHTGGDISCRSFCKENKYMHALGYLVNMILHACSYMYIAIHLRSCTHSYVRMSSLRIRTYIAIVSVVKLYVCKSALAPFIDTKLRAYIAIRCYLFIVTSSNLKHRCRFINTRVKLTHECT